MPATLRPPISTSFGCFTVVSTPACAASASATAAPATSESSGSRSDGTSRLEHDREEEARAGGRVPRAAESPAALRLLVRRDDGALARTVEEALSRRASIDERVWTTEAAAQSVRHPRAHYTRRP